MGTSSETREDARAGSAIEGAARLAAASPSWSGAARERSPFPALPDGWSVIGRCRLGTGVPGPHATGCYALAHPKVGVALIDIVPDATPNAEARLRRALAAAEFWPDFPGTLPVVHNRLDAAALRSLPWVLERWFAALPALTVPGGSAWIEGVRRAMAVDPAWELPGQPKTAPDAPFAATDGAGNAPPAPRPPGRTAWAPRRPGGWGKLATMPMAFASVFALGLVSGFILLESSKPGDRPAPATAAQPQSAAVPQEAAPKAAEVAAATPRSSAAAPAETPKPATTDAPSASRSEPAAPASAPASAPAPAAPSPSPAAAQAGPASPASAEAPSPAAPEDPAAMQKVAGLALDAGGEPQAGSALETRVLHAVPIGEALPMAPPRAPAAPPVRASASQAPSRPVPVVDRACSQALFRFQQGERLTAAEQNFVRTGCSTARR